jgi:DNA transformation protein
MASPPHHYLADCLAPWGEIRLKRMFGGMGVYRGDLFFALIDDDIVYFKVDETTRPDFEAAGSEPFSYPGKDGQLMLMNGYWRLPDEVIEDRDTLFIWADKALAVARRSAKPKPVKLTSDTVHGLGPGLGPKSKKWLKDIGITTRKDLEKTGAIDAYARLKDLYPETVSLNLLWGLYAILNGIDVKAVTPDVKDHLVSLLASHTGGTTR